MSLLGVLGCAYAFGRIRGRKESAMQAVLDGPTVRVGDCEAREEE